MKIKKNKFPDYITFPRTFEKYKWHKPLLTIVLTAVFYLIFQIILIIIFSKVYGSEILSLIKIGAYETLNTSDVITSFTYLSIFLFIPALYIASKIVNYRPFSSYSSSRGGWNWKIYFKCLGIAFVIYLINSVIDYAVHGRTGAVTQISPILLVLALIIIPLQGIAEEYIYRGLLMQSFGSWFKIPILAIIIQGIIFSVSHSYNVTGLISVFVTGIIYGLLTWRTNGLEASSAIHSINNLTAFYFIALGLKSLSSNVSTVDFVTDILVAAISAGLIYYIGCKKEWFSETS